MGFLMLQVIFSKIGLEIPPFLTVIQFYQRKTCSQEPTKKFNAAYMQKYSLPTITLKEQDKTKIEFPYGMVSKHAFLYF